MLPDDLDLQQLTQELRTRLKPGEPIGYLRGKSLMRDLIVHEFGFSELDAEALIDTLEARGFLHFLGDPADRSHAESHWDLQSKP